MRVYGAALKIFLSLQHHKLLNFIDMNFIEFVEKYQQDMTPEQMLNIAKAIGKYLSYNPQNEMFDNRKTKRCVFKTKRIFFLFPPPL